MPQGGFNPATSATPARLALTPEVRGLWVEFAALDYSAPERNRYAHRLQGFDKDWIPRIDPPAGQLHQPAAR